MTLKEKFDEYAREYDAVRRILIPCYDDFYDKTTDFITHIIPRPKKILDLGAGTGILDSYWYTQIPEADYLLTDMSEGMLSVAKDRFKDVANVRFQALDYKNESLPKETFDVILSALSIHHLEHEEKEALFARIYDALPEGGIFINYEQFCGETPDMEQSYIDYWIGQMKAAGLSEKEFTGWEERRAYDKECSLTQEMEMFRRVGFPKVDCVYSMQKFSVIMCVK